MNCPKCNAELKPGARFCHVCGFDSQSVPTPPPAEPTQEFSQPTYTPTTVYNQNESEFSKQSNSNLMKTNNIFFNFIRPVLNYIDNGSFFKKPFSWLYLLIAVLNLLLPLYIFYQAVDNKIFSSEAKVVIAFLLVWIVVAAAFWVGFQLWWDRKDKVLTTSKEGDDFPVTPVFSHLIQTLGEWFGGLIAIMGFGFTLFANLFLGKEADMLSHYMGLNFFDKGWLGLILFPIIGFFIIVGFRFMAELWRALTAIANNTKK